MAGDGMLRLDEDAIRAKVIELFTACNRTRMDLWIFSGVTAGVLDGKIVEKVMNEEIHLRPPLVQRYWIGVPCNCHGQLN